MKQNFLIIALLFSSCSYADQPIELFQITCIEDMRYFELKSNLYHEAAEFLNTGFERGQKTAADFETRIELLKSNGLYVPNDMSFTCALKNKEYSDKKELQDIANTLNMSGLELPEKMKASLERKETVFYKVKSHKDNARERGMCGGSPTASLSLWRDDELWIDDVLVNERCFDKPSITRIIVNEGKMGWYARNLTICIKEDHSSKEGCVFISDQSSSKISKIIPVTNTNLLNIIRDNPIKTSP